MAKFESTPRIGRSQGASIFWGLVSVFFAGAACFYFWKDHEDATRAMQLSDTVLSLQEQSETLASQKQELEASADDQKKQLDVRDEFLQEKEAKLAQEESRLESLGVQTQDQSQQIQSQAAVVKKFDAAVRKISKNTDNADVVARGGRPVLRVPAAALFATGDATLTHDGKALLGQIAQALNGQIDNFELRIDSFTDGDAETAAATGASPSPSGNTDKPDQKKDNPDTTAKPHFASGWDLTAARATAISRYFRDHTSLPFQNVIVVARGDFQPIVPNGKEGHARNRRIEITIAPEAPAYHGSDSSAAASPEKKSAAPVNPLTPPPDQPASGN
ncbi:MAG: OmpA family protein [Methylacidiphilales bacterium]|nr:OmpA family protein [Candidatus Methylacidiphilales bacterium]